MQILAPLVGGVLIGLATAAMLVLHGRVAGVSGIVGELVERSDGQNRWRIAFLAGLVAGGVLLQQFLPASLGLRCHPVRCWSSRVSSSASARG